MRRRTEWAVIAFLVACLCAYSGSKDTRVDRLRRDLQQTMQRMGREHEPLEIEQVEAGADCPGVVVRAVSPRSAGLTCLIHFLAAGQGCRVLRLTGPQPSSPPALLTQRLQSRSQQQLDRVFGPGRAVVVVHCLFQEQSLATPSAPPLAIDQISAWLLLNVPRQQDVLPWALGIVRDSLGMEESKGDTVHYLPQAEQD